VTQPSENNPCSQPLGLPLNDQLGPTPQGRAMADAPLDGSLVQLLVRFDNHAIEDTTKPAWTIGSHNDGEWNFVGWCWHRDEWTRGSGDLLGWLPMGPNLNSQTPTAR
jgi:hypothetical protein